MDQIFTYELLCLLFLVSGLISGIILRSRKKPYSILISGIHKLSTLLMLLFFILYAVQQQDGIEVATGRGIIFILTIILFIGSLATGALVQGLKAEFKWLKLSHRLLPVLCYACGIFYYFYN